jgi:hypothetical protein
MLPVVALKMRKLPTIKSLPHSKETNREKMWGQQPRLSRGEAPQDSILITGMLSG